MAEKLRASIPLPDPVTLHVPRSRLWHGQQSCSPGCCWRAGRPPPAHLPPAPPATVTEVFQYVLLKWFCRYIHTNVLWTLCAYTYINIIIACMICIDLYYISIYIIYVLCISYYILYIIYIIYQMHRCVHTHNHTQHICIYIKYTYTQTDPHALCVSEKGSTHASRRQPFQEPRFRFLLEWKKLGQKRTKPSVGTHPTATLGKIARKTSGWRIHLFHSDLEVWQEGCGALREWTHMAWK